ncbi:RNA-directed DNA polymerase, eukaryota [Tanacetum coccineum]
MVQGIMIDGIWVTDPQHVKMTFHTFYKDKFDVSDSLTELSPVVPFATLSQEDSMELEKSVTLKEIRATVWDCGSQKSLGPDGFSFLFRKSYWELLKEDVGNSVRCVLESFVMPRGVNSSFITLIPKISNPIHIKDFRPISLIGMQYKIIAKILANRLSKVIDKVVSKEQSAFIAGRQILDGPIVLSELMPCQLYKVDFENAFDTVFFLASGLKINVSKSNVYGLGVSPRDVEDMASHTLSISPISVYLLERICN